MTESIPIIKKKKLPFRSAGGLAHHTSAREPGPCHLFIRWVSQANTLAKGEMTEFSSRFSKGDVY